MEECLICCQGGGKLITLTVKGKNSLREFAILRRDDRVIAELNKEAKYVVHEHCRKWFNNRKRIASTVNQDNSNKTIRVETRSESKSFEWCLHCFICGNDLDKKNKYVHHVKNVGVKDTVLKDCELRLCIKSDDIWAIDVKSRLVNCIDLVAVEAVYHHKCRTDFSLAKSTEISKSKGLPVNTDLRSAFEETCEWLESESVLHTLQEFVEKLKEIAGTNEPYVNKHVKSLLVKKYENYLSFTSQGEGKSPILSFQHTTQYLIKQKFKCDNHDDITQEKERMIKVLSKNNKR